MVCLSRRYLSLPVLTYQKFATTAQPFLYRKPASPRITQRLQYRTLILKASARGHSQNSRKSVKIRFQVLCSQRRT
jgi:hypothetical protein